MSLALPIHFEVDRDRITPAETYGQARVSSLDSIDDCEVNDLSQVGAEIRTSGKFELNQRVDLEMLPIGPIPGRVVWCHGHDFGIQFMAPLDRQSLAKVPRPIQGKSRCRTDRRPRFARADLEARLVSLSRKLSDSDLETALGQIAALSSHQGR